MEPSSTKAIFQNDGSSGVIGVAHSAVHIITHIKHLYPKVTPNADDIFFGITKPETDFTGRSIELDELQRFLCTDAETKIVAVCGMGGIGKTQLARQFIEDNKGQFNNCIWIRSENFESIHKSFRDLLKDELGLATRDANGDEMDLKSIIAKTLRLLYKKKTLFVYDNVDTMTDIMKYILAMAPPPEAEKPKILVTTRIVQWRQGIEVIHLEVWSKIESVAYISKTFDMSIKDTDAEMGTLANMLQYFPLALRQATAFIKEQRRKNGIFGISKFIDRYNRQTRKMLDDDKFRDHLTGEYDKTTYTTWLITMEEIENDKTNGELAIRILRICAFFEADRILRDYFYWLPLSDDNQEDAEIDNDEREEMVDSAVDVLMKYCMISSVSEQKIFSIHRLVQLVTKFVSEESNKVEPVVRNALQMCSNIIDGNVVALSEYLTQTVSVLKFILTLPDPRKEKLLIEFSALPHSILTFESKLNIYQRKAAIHETHIMKLANVILEQLSKILEPCHRDVLKFQYCVALRVYDWSGTPNILLDIHDKQKTHFGEADPDTLETQYRIARVYLELGNFKDASHSYNEALSIEWKCSGGKDRRIMGPIIELAEFYKKRHENYFAARLFEIICAQQRNIMMEDDTVILQTIEEVFQGHIKAGSYKFAIEWCDELLQCHCKRNNFHIFEQILDEASSYSRKGKHYIALRLNENVFEKQKISLGEDHNDTLKTLFLIADEHSRLQNYHLARQLFEFIYEEQKRRLDKAHPDIQKSLRAIAYVRSKLSNSSDPTIQLLQTVVEIGMKIDKPDPPLHEKITHDVTAYADDPWSLRYANEKHYDVALQRYVLTFSTQKTRLGEDHPDTIDTMCEMARLNSKLRNNDSLLQLHQKISAKLKTIDENCNTFQEMCLLGRLHSLIGNNDIANHWYRKSLETEFESTGDVPFNFKKEISFQISYGNYYLVEQLYEFLYEKEKNRRGENHYRTIDKMCGMAQACTLMRKHDLALKWYDDAFQRDESKAIVISRICSEVFHQIDNDDGNYDFALRLSDVILKRFSIEDYVNYRHNYSSMREIAHMCAKLKKNDAALIFYQFAFKKQTDLTYTNYNSEEFELLINKYQIAAAFNIHEKNHLTALRLYEMIFEIQKIRWGENHPETIKTMCDMANVHNLLLNKQLALNTYRNVLEHQKSCQGEFHPDTIGTMSALASLNMELGNDVDALQSYRKLLKIRNFLKGSTDPETIETESHIVSLQQKVGQQEVSDNPENYIAFAFPVEYRIVEWWEEHKKPINIDINEFISTLFKSMSDEMAILTR